MSRYRTFGKIDGQIIIIDISSQHKNIPVSLSSTDDSQGYSVQFYLDGVKYFYDKIQPQMKDGMSFAKCLQTTLQELFLEEGGLRPAKYNPEFKDVKKDQKSKSKDSEKPFFTIADYIKKIKSGEDLEEINLKGRGIKSGEIEELAEVLKDKNVKRIYLSHNQIGNTEAHSIVKILQLPKLKLLDLSFNEIGNRGASAIANTLEILQGLEDSEDIELLEINLRNNKIGDKGADEFIEFLEGGGKALIRLSYNPIKKDKFETLLSFRKEDSSPEQAPRSALRSATAKPFADKDQIKSKSLHE